MKSFKIVAAVVALVLLCSGCFAAGRQTSVPTVQRQSAHALPAPYYQMLQQNIGQPGCGPIYLGNSSPAQVGAVVASVLVRARPDVIVVYKSTVMASPFFTACAADRG